MFSVIVKIETSVPSEGWVGTEVQPLARGLDVRTSVLSSANGEEQLDPALVGR